MARLPCIGRRAFSCGARLSIAVTSKTDLAMTGLMANPDQELEAALSDAKTAEQRVRPLQKYYDACESFLEPFNAQLACKNGCYICCHIPVKAQSHEIFALAEFIEKRFSEAQREALLMRLREHVKVSSAMTEKERLGTNLVCPMLVDGSCSIHPARPFACRRYHSLDVKACEYSYENPQDLKASRPRNPVLENRWQELAVLANKAYQNTGHKSEPVELTRALLNALDNPKCRKRWSKGNSAMLDQ